MAQEQYIFDDGVIISKETLSYPLSDGQMQTQERSEIHCMEKGQLLLSHSTDVPNYSKLKTATHRRDPYIRSRPYSKFSQGTGNYSGKNNFEKVFEMYVNYPPDPNLAQFEQTHQTMAEVIEARKSLKGPCQNLACNMACGATAGMGHLCVEKLYEKAKSWQTSPCRRVSVAVKCLADGNRPHYCPQFAPTDPSHPWNTLEREHPSYSFQANPGFLAWIRSHINKPMHYVRKDQRLAYFTPDKPSRNSLRENSYSPQSPPYVRSDSIACTDSNSDIVSRLGLTLPTDEEIDRDPIFSDISEMSTDELEERPTVSEVEQATIEEFVKSRTIKEEEDVSKGERTLTVLMPVSKLVADVKEMISVAPATDIYGWTDTLAMVDLWEVIEANDEYRKLHGVELLQRLFRMMELTNRYVLYDSTMHGSHYDTPQGKGLARQDAQLDIPAEYEEESRLKGLSVCPIAVTAGDPCTLYWARNNWFCNHGYTDDIFYMRPLWNKFKDAKDPLAKSISRNCPLLKACFVANAKKVICPVVMENPSDRHSVIIANGTYWCSHGYTNNAAASCNTNN